MTMCAHDDCVHVNVLIPAELACSGAAYRRDMLIDRCIAPLVDALQKGGIDMNSSCCGHGKHEGHISLQDGRLLLVLDKSRADKYFVDRPACIVSLLDKSDI